MTSEIGHNWPFWINVNLKRIFFRHCCLRVSRSRSHWSDNDKNVSGKYRFDYSYRSFVAFLFSLFFSFFFYQHAQHNRRTISLSLSLSLHLCAHVPVHAQARSRIPTYFSANIVLFFSVAFRISPLPARNYVSYCNEYYIKRERGQMQGIKSKQNACFFCQLGTGNWELAYKRKLEK